MARDINDLLQKNVRRPCGLISQFQSGQHHFAELQKSGVQWSPVGRLNGRDDHELFVSHGPQSPFKR